MDTILASIRRILNEDEAAPAEAPVMPPHDEPAEDVLVLGEAMMVPPPRPEPVPLRVEPPRTEAMRVEPPRPEAMRVEPPRPEAMRVEPPRPEAMRVEPPRIESTVIEPVSQLFGAVAPTERPSIEGLVAARTRVAASLSFDALHEAIKRDQEPKVVERSPMVLRAGGPTLEDLVRDELRGLLTTWLDVHLPGMVETMVRTEIEKLTRRG